MVLPVNRHGRQEPLWMTAKQDRQCSKCAWDIIQGERIVYDPQSFKSYCSVCGADELGDDPSIDKTGHWQGCYC